MPGGIENPQGEVQVYFNLRQGRGRPDAPSSRTPLPFLCTVPHPLNRIYRLFPEFALTAVCTTASMDSSDAIPDMRQQNHQT
jgi:hypothetical protein